MPASPTVEEYADQTYRIADISELREHPENPNQGDVGAIHTSTEANGWYGAVIVQKSTGYVLAGNHRLKERKARGLKRVPIIERDVDDATALRIMLADNRVAQLASYDDDALLALLQREAMRDNLQGTGWEGDDIDVLHKLREADDERAAALGEDYTTKVESPIYTPTGPQPPVSALVETDRRDLLLEEIEAADVPLEVSEFLTMAAQRHVRFDYETIANYYAHAPAEIQRLMEASALVIIDYRQAIERGFVTLHEAVDAAFHEDYPDA